ncbi:hypothetical protein J6590_104555 [Homalodisca vitripennis]|nr:hypothetical protein J6590_104555 [Homalodisca vitripennis]
MVSGSVTQAKSTVLQRILQKKRDISSSNPHLPQTSYISDPELSSLVKSLFQRTTYRDAANFMVMETVFTVHTSCLMKQVLILEQPGYLAERLHHRSEVALPNTHNQIKQRRAWPLLGQVTADRSCPCKRPACPAIGGGSEVTFKPLVSRLSVREGFLALTSPGKIRHSLLYFYFYKRLVCL